MFTMFPMPHLKKINAMPAKQRAKLFDAIRRHIKTSPEITRMLEGSGGGAGASPKKRARPKAKKKKGRGRPKKTGGTR